MWAEAEKLERGSMPWGEMGFQGQGEEDKRRRLV